MFVHIFIDLLCMSLSWHEIRYRTFHPAPSRVSGLQLLSDDVGARRGQLVPAAGAAADSPDQDTLLCGARGRGFFRGADSFGYISRQWMTSLDLCLPPMSKYKQTLLWNGFPVLTERHDDFPPCPPLLPQVERPAPTRPPHLPVQSHLCSGCRKTYWSDSHSVRDHTTRTMIKPLHQQLATPGLYPMFHLPCPWGGHRLDSPPPPPGSHLERGQGQAAHGGEAAHGAHGGAAAQVGEEVGVGEGAEAGWGEVSQSRSRKRIWVRKVWAEIRVQLKLENYKYPLQKLSAL